MHWFLFLVRRFLDAFLRRVRDRYFCDEDEWSGGGDGEEEDREYEWEEVDEEEAEIEEDFRKLIGKLICVNVHY